jgi:phosphoribosylformylglycinamidine (FGAM) synthase-like enzyme
LTEHCEHRITQQLLQGNDEVDSERLIMSIERRAQADLDIRQDLAYPSRPWTWGINGRL